MSKPTRSPLMMHVMLKTYDVNLVRHHEIIKMFSDKYNINEYGANGSSGCFFTHGDNLYDVNNNKRLRKLYEKGIKKKKINGDYVYINFYQDDTDTTTTDTTTTDTEYEEPPQHTREEIRRHVIKTMTNNIVRSYDNKRVIVLNDDTIYNDYVKLMHIQNNLDTNLLKPSINFNIGDFIYKDRSINRCDNIYEVVRVTKKRLYIRPLLSRLIIKYNDYNIYRVKRGVYGTSAVSYTDKTTVTHKYILDNDFMYIQQ